MFVYTAKNGNIVTLRDNAEQEMFSPRLKELGFVLTPSEDKPLTIDTTFDTYEFASPVDQEIPDLDEDDEDDEEE